MTRIKYSFKQFSNIKRIVEVLYDPLFLMIFSLFIALFSNYIKKNSILIFSVASILILLKKPKAYFTVIFSALIFFKIYFEIFSQNSAFYSVKTYISKYNINFISGQIYKDSVVSKSGRQTHFLKISSMEGKGGVILHVNNAKAIVFMDKAYFFEGQNLKLELSSIFIQKNSIFVLSKTYKELHKNIFFSFRILILQFLQNRLDFLKSNLKGLSSTLILGQREFLQSDLYNSFLKSNLNHFLAVSGFHLSFIVAFTSFFLSFLGDYRIKNSINLILVLLYLCLVGFIPSLLRTSIFYLMSILFYASRVDRRRIFFFSLLINLFLFPDQLFDLSFLFSYAAFLGIVFLYPLFKTMFRGVFKIFLPFVFSFSSSFFIYFIIFYLQGNISLLSIIFSSFVAYFIISYFILSTLIFVFQSNILALLLQFNYDILFASSNFLSKHFSFKILLLDREKILLNFVFTFFLALVLFLNLNKNIENTQDIS